MFCLCKSTNNRHSFTFLNTDTSIDFIKIKNFNEEYSPNLRNPKNKTIVIYGDNFIFITQFAFLNKKECDIVIPHIGKVSDLTYIINIILNNYVEDIKKENESKNNFFLNFKFQNHVDSYVIYTIEKLLCTNHYTNFEGRVCFHVPILFNENGELELSINENYIKNDEYNESINTIYRPSHYSSLEKEFYEKLSYPPMDFTKSTAQSINNI